MALVDISRINAEQPVSKAIGHLRSVLLENKAVLTYGRKSLASVRIGKHTATNSYPAIFIQPTRVGYGEGPLGVKYEVSMEFHLLSAVTSVGTENSELNAAKFTDALVTVLSEQPEEDGVWRELEIGRRQAGIYPSGRGPDVAGSILSIVAHRYLESDFS